MAGFTSAGLKLFVTSISRHIFPDAHQDLAITGSLKFQRGIFKEVQFPSVVVPFIYAINIMCFLHQGNSIQTVIGYLSNFLRTLSMRFWTNKGCWWGITAILLCIRDKIQKWSRFFWPVVHKMNIIITIYIVQLHSVFN